MLKNAVKQLTACACLRDQIEVLLILIELVQFQYIRMILL